MDEFTCETGSEVDKEAPEEHEDALSIDFSLGTGERRFSNTLLCTEEEDECPRPEDSPFPWSSSLLPSVYRSSSLIQLSSSC